MNEHGIFAIGHSTRPFDDFVQLLQAHGIDTLADIRTVPKSRHNPQYTQEFLAAELPRHQIRYVHLKALGGLRRPRPDSINLGWENTSFRGYADYMQTPEFAAAIDALLALGAGQPTAIMCAEAVPWRCHRSLVGDALVARGVEADEIVSASKASPHKLTSFARVEGTMVTYPPE